MKVLRKNYLGIDVSKPWFDVSLLVVLDHEKQAIITDRFNNSPEAYGPAAFQLGIFYTKTIMFQQSKYLLYKQSGDIPSYHS